MKTADRAIRSIIAIAFIGLYYSGTVTGWLGITLIAFSVIFLLTSFIGFCPLYLPLLPLKRDLGLVHHNFGNYQAFFQKLGAEHNT
ncbi:MAG: DUF2892 domain-containing protein [Flammeovirgaceae bacterium]|nr:DUF2892 domain-containing protein [Flammeovirgaceae bacterium]